MRPDSLRNRLMIYLISLILSFLLLISIALFISFRLNNLNRAELVFNSFVTEWKVLHKVSRNIYFSNDTFELIVDEWIESYNKLEKNYRDIIDKRVVESIPDRDIREKMYHVLDTWLILKGYLNDIETRVTDLSKSRILNDIERLLVPLNTLEKAEYSYIYEDEEFVMISRLKQSIDVLDYSGNLFHKLLLELQYDFSSYMNRIFYIWRIVLIPIIIASISSAIILILNILKLNKSMSNTIKDQMIDLNNQLIELRHTQDKLVESERQASIIHLITGIAHEVNTPLGVGITTITHLNDSFESNNRESTSIKNSLELLEYSFSKIDRLISTLKKFVQISSDINYTTINVQDFLTSLVTNHFIQDNPHITWDIDSNDIIYSDNEYLNIAIIPILDNWRDHNDFKSTTFTIRFKINSKYNFIIFEDNGGLMDESTEKKCLQPFYTSDRKSGRVGLGLSLTANIILNRLNGRVYCFNSVTSNGVKTVLRLPRF